MHLFNFLMALSIPFVPLHLPATSMNEASSRGHCIVMVRVERYDSADGTTRTGRLCMVDLAGSERADRTGVSERTEHNAMPTPPFEAEKCRTLCAVFSFLLCTVFYCPIGLID